MNSQLEILEIKQLMARLLTDINLLIPQKNERRLHIRSYKYEQTSYT